MAVLNVVRLGGQIIVLGEPGTMGQLPAVPKHRVRVRVLTKIYYDMNFFPF